jgi:hypothetical protein
MYTLPDSIKNSVVTKKNFDLVLILRFWDQGI